MNQALNSHATKAKNQIACDPLRVIPVQSRFCLHSNGRRPPVGDLITSGATNPKLNGIAYESSFKLQENFLGCVFLSLFGIHFGPQTQYNIQSIQATSVRSRYPWEFRPISI